MFNFSNLEEVFNEYFSQKDIYVTLKVTKEQAKIGVSMPVEINRKIINKDKSYSIEKDIETVKIPKNSKNNTVIKIKNKGNKFSYNMETGDLYVEIKIFGIK